MKTGSRPARYKKNRNTAPTKNPSRPDRNSLMTTSHRIIHITGISTINERFVDELSKRERNELYARSL